MKKCYNCNLEKDVKEFSLNKSHKDGLSSACKSCHKSLRRQHYLKNRSKILEQVSHRKEEFYNWARSLKDNKSCKDCNKTYRYYVMEFDHLSNKEFHISEAVSKSWSKNRILKEISKCELVCSNCHKERTHQRQAGLV